MTRKIINLKYASPKSGPVDCPGRMHDLAPLQFGECRLEKQCRLLFSHLFTVSVSRWLSETVETTPQVLFKSLLIILNFKDSQSVRTVISMRILPVRACLLPLNNP